VLCVDDDPSVLVALRVALGDLCAVREAPTLEAARKALDGETIDVVILDVMLCGESGFGLLEELVGKGGRTSIVMLSAIEDSETALKAIRLGARDYISKPFDVHRLRRLVSRLVRERSPATGELFHQEVLCEGDRTDIVSRHKKMIELYRQAERVARMDSSVLIHGESGCGKEVIARYIHQTSPRRKGPFAAIHCGGVPDSLLESELFGYEKGAFTGAQATCKGRLELASGGTLFLDEIGTMPLAMQIKLLRVLQERCVERVGGRESIPLDFRMITASNVDLNALIAQGRFRSDLYYRLNVVHISVPPLRERKEDVPVLIDYFIERFHEKFNMAKIRINKALMNYLVEYPWPGNVRQLKNTVESFYALSGSEITFSCLPREMLPAFIPRATEPAEEGLLNLEDAVARFEKSHIDKAILMCGGNQTRAAHLLKIHRNTLINKMNRRKRD
jgi:two-component system nitrogen regulation response regulator NtrX